MQSNHTYSWEPPSYTDPIPCNSTVPAFNRLSERTIGKSRLGDEEEKLLGSKNDPSWCEGKARPEWQRGRVGFQVDNVTRGTTNMVRESRDMVGRGRQR